MAALEADLTTKTQQEDKLKEQIDKMKEKAKGSVLMGAMSKLKMPKLPVGPSKTETELETATRERDEYQKMLKQQQDAAKELQDLMEIQDSELRDAAANLQVALQKAKAAEGDRDGLEAQLSQVKASVATLEGEKAGLQNAGRGSRVGVRWSGLPMAAGRSPTAKRAVAEGEWRGLGAGCGCLGRALAGPGDLRCRGLGR